MTIFLQELFLTVLNMSITASYVILFVMIGRLFLKKMPKIFSYVLWGIVLFRLVSPFSFSSALSFLKGGTSNYGKIEYIPFNMDMMGGYKIDIGAGAVNTSISHTLPVVMSYTTTNPIQIALFVFAVVWILGVLALIAYSIRSYFMLKYKVSMAMLLQDNVFECEDISSPFVLGIINPKIYLPIGLSEIEKTYILRHEEIHIRRFDYLIKPFAFLALCVHWFNPLVWLSFVLMSHDMEMSCDEQVIKELGMDIKKDYSASILSFAANRKMINGSPLAFGETGAKGRIQNVLNYKRPAFWVSIVVAIAVAVISIGLSSNSNTFTYYDKEKIHMAEIWAEGLKTRDGKLRYEIMSEGMKERFVEEQKERSGSEEWHYNIGYSSPGVVNYEIDMQGDTAVIIYYMTDSDGEIYEKTEIITFGKENNQLVIIDAREKFAQWEEVRYFAATARQAMETYSKALLESDYPALLSLVHTENFDPIGQEIWDTVKINSIKVFSEDVRDNKACYGLELDIKDGGSSSFETGVFPRWLWLVKGELGWYVEGLMTSGEPDDSWWDSKSEQIDEIDIKDLTEKSIITSDRYNNTKYPLIAEIPQENIYLYGINSTGSGAVLKYGENIQAFDWIYTTPRFILPTLEKYDVDNDGQDEIMCVLNVGSGTGCAVYELHILKFDQTFGYIDYVFSDYITQIKAMFSFTYNENENSILLKTKNDSYTYIVPKEYQELTFKDIAYGDIVYFNISDGLEMKILPGIVVEGIAPPLFFEDIILKGDIIFKNGKFEITSLQIIKD